MTVTDEDRTKAHALWNEILCNGGVPGWSVREAIAAALASERAAADQLRADVLALAEELEGAIGDGDDDEWENGYRRGLVYSAARLRALLDAR